MNQREVISGLEQIIEVFETLKVSLESNEIDEKDVAELLLEIFHPSLISKNKEHENLQKLFKSLTLQASGNRCPKCNGRGVI